MTQMIVLFFGTDLEDEEEAKSLCQEMIEWVQRERDLHGATKDELNIQGVVIDT